MKVQRVFQQLAVALFWVHLLVSGVAWAWPPTMSSELNFVRQDLKDAFLRRFKAGGISYANRVGREEKAAAAELKDAVLAKCLSDCVVSEKKGKHGVTEFHVKLKNGLGFNIAIDPGCVEVQLDPATPAHFRKRVRVLDRMLFDVAKERGFVHELPDGWVQNAHLNVGALSAFEDKPEAFPRHIADRAATPELDIGILGSNYKNAPTISELAADQQNALKTMIDSVNAGTLDGFTTRPSAKRAAAVRKIADEMNNEVYTKTPGIPHGSGDHYQAFAMKYLSSDPFPAQDQPFEFRSLRQPRNAHELVLTLEMTEARIDFSRKRRGPIHLLLPSRLDQSVENQAAAFYLYTAEMNQDWQRYLPILPDSIANQLKEGWVQKALGGKFNWNDSRHLNLLNHQLAERFLLSSYRRERLSRILSRSDIPEKALSETLKILNQQAHSFPERTQEVRDLYRTVNRRLGKGTAEHRKRFVFDQAAQSVLEKCTRTQLERQFKGDFSRL